MSPQDYPLLPLLMDQHVPMDMAHRVVGVLMEEGLDTIADVRAYHASQPNGLRALLGTTHARALYYGLALADG